ncbi:DeoR/GlpR family DNA-binding transcription regulator [Vibrio alginolyticus]|uniref:DeoR/GlpR family DNA-binding transcription regulator n=1 Tax=Vibrio alginolyticus TaxID=663 RepID=UPI001BD51070|nr:DeoR/GlpR family DNA-binding transcription regulator [Vibrio alginolyticus]MBT0043108.1 DeoR/GlpR transcriptional regulator [Vibrio alginolyticus]
MKKCIAEQRQRLLLDILAKEGSLNASDVAQRLETTGITIRRDLNKLAEMGLCKRTHGGAILNTPASGSVNERCSQHVDEKQKLAEVAISLLKKGQLIFIDASSSSMVFADRVPTDLELTIVTNSVHIAMSLFNSGQKNVILIGGQVDCSLGAVVDAKAVSEIQAFNFDMVFIGVCGWSKESGFTALNYSDANFKQQLFKQGGALTVIFTEEKDQTSAPYRLMDVSDIDYLVCAGDNTSVVGEATKNDVSILYPII